MGIQFLLKSPTSMKFKNLILSAAASVFTYSSVATANDFIDLNSNNVKVVFTEVVVDGETVKQATATVSETVNGVTTVKRQTEVIVPNGDGTFEKRVTQETTVATFDSDNNVYNVETSTELITTQLDSNFDNVGEPVTTTPPVVIVNNVAPGDLDLPQATTFIPVDESLDEPMVFSPE
ncbi:hypothetical protein N9Z15_04680 [Akkermansiaceae bacterium]|nr:hypothetical protein [Akkermansiaceae bacterium]